MAKSKTSGATGNRHAIVNTQAMPVQDGFADLVYDYTKIDEKDRVFLKQAAVEIHTRQRNAVENMIAIGRLLNVVFTRIEGRFNEWVLEEFGMSLSNASELRNVADRFDETDTIIVSLQPTVVRMLAAPSVPDEAVAAVRQLATSTNGVVKVKQARAIVDEFRFEMPVRAPAAPPAPIAMFPVEEADIEAEYTVLTTAPVMSDASDRYELRRRIVTPMYMAPAPLKNGEVVAVVLPTAIAKKLHAAVLINSLRFHLSPEEQIELRQALEESFPALPQVGS